MQQPPLSVLATFPPPNYVDPVTHGNANIILNLVLFGLLLLFIGIRMFTRSSLNYVFGADDVFILIAMIPASAFFIISLLADYHYMWLRHTWDIPLTHIETGLKMVLGAQLAFALACTLTKLSMLMLVHRLLSSSTLFWRRVTLFGIVLVATQGTVFCITVIFQCRPPQDYWKVTIDPQPNCINQEWSLLVAGIINTLTDFLVVVLPIRTVWSLQLPVRQTLVIILLFACGFMSCGAGAARTYCMWEVTQTWDRVWASYPVWITAAIELYVGMICASIPATKPFFKTYLPQIFGAMTNSTHFTGNSSDSRNPLQKRTRTEVTVDEVAEDGLSFEKMMTNSRKKKTLVTCRRESQYGGSDCGSQIRITHTFDVERGRESGVET